VLTFDQHHRPRPSGTRVLILSGIHPGLDNNTVINRVHRRAEFIIVAGCVFSDPTDDFLVHQVSLLLDVGRQPGSFEPAAARIMQELDLTKPNIVLPVEIEPGVRGSSHRLQFVASLLKDLGIELTAFGVDVEYLTDSERVLTDQVSEVLRIFLDRLPLSQDRTSCLLPLRPSVIVKESLQSTVARQKSEVQAAGSLPVRPALIVVTLIGQLLVCLPSLIGCVHELYGGSAHALTTDVYASFQTGLDKFPPLRDVTGQGFPQLLSDITVQDGLVVLRFSGGTVVHL